MGGTLRADSTLLNPSRGARERMGHVSWLMGKTQKNVEALGPGEIGVAQKLKETQTGDTLCDETQAFELPRITFPEAAISFAIQPKTRGDEDKISNALARIAEEDPTVHYHFDPETKQLLVAGVGSLHVEMVVERMKRKYNVDVNLLPPRIPYKETVKGRAEGQGKYKKQTGGRGQYGDVWLRAEPLPRGGGFEFVDDIFGGAVPRNYIPSAEKGVRDCMKKGIYAGYPVVDLRVTLYDGSYHDVDSSDMAFQIAASLGLQKVFIEAHPILLEPIMNVEVTCPSDAAGDIIGDLNSRRGRIVGMEPAGETAVVRAAVPMAEMLTYESSLRSMTGGRGTYSMEFSHYEEGPAFLADHISGNRDLATATGAPIFAHAAAGLAFDHERLRDGDAIGVGNVRLTVAHTPGHTPDSICLLVTDLERGAEPWFVLTGDTLFVGSVGRPDLGGARAAEEAYESLTRVLLRLDDSVEIYPAHGAGSACGRAMSAKTGSTIGFERRFNAALQLRDRAAFVDFIMRDLPPKPPQFEKIVGKNRGLIPLHSAKPRPYAAREAWEAVQRGECVVDLRDPGTYGESHIPGALNVWIDSPQFAERVA